ncbi:MAG: alpha/beta hydrolase [Candidatus Omnitrophica bacterium]|nr:alpha/beta hydrolase [Candidatus Omnitrophota bacterium]
MLASQMTPGLNKKEVTLVLLHAFPFSSAMWDWERAEISQYANVLTPDLPGFGGSVRQPMPSITLMAEEVENLLNHLKIYEPVVIGGISMGGYVAFEFLRRTPERVRGLMLFSTRSGPDTEQEREERLHTIEKIQQYGVENFAENRHKKLLGVTSLNSRPEVSEKVMNLLLTNHAGGMCDALLAMAGRRDASDLLTSISCPCLIVAGEEDRVILPLESQVMHDTISGSEFYTIPRTGHLVTLERPDICGALMENFLETEILYQMKKSA